MVSEQMPRLVMLYELNWTSNGHLIWHSTVRGHSTNAPKILEPVSIHSEFLEVTCVKLLCMRREKYFSLKWFRRDAIRFFLHSLKTLPRGGPPEALMGLARTFEQVRADTMSERCLYQFGFHPELARTRGSSLRNLIRLLIDLVQDPLKHCYSTGSTYLHELAPAADGTIDLMARNGERMRSRNYNVRFLERNLLTRDARTAIESLSCADAEMLLFHGTSEKSAQLIVQ
jgi:hypothetical protein